MGKRGWKVVETEFGKGKIEISVNIFSHEVGSRIILEDEESKQPPRATAKPTRSAGT